MRPLAIVPPKQPRRNIMKGKLIDRIVMAIVVSTLSSAGVSIAAEGDQRPREEQKADQHGAPREEKPRPPQKAQNAPQKQKQEQQRERAQEKAAQEQKDQRVQQERVERRSEQIQQQQRVQQQKQEKVQQQRQQQRLSQQRQQERAARERAAQLERQKRMAQYRFQQDYLERVRRQQIYLRDHRFDYDHDPYFYTAPIYRYNRGGRYYEVHEYDEKTLREAVN